MRHAAVNGTAGQGGLVKPLGMLCLLAAMLMGASSAEARDRRDRGDFSEHGNDGGRHHRSLSADEAANRAASRRGGRPLSVRRASEDGRPYYDVKMLSRGEVWLERVYPEE
jgi:hypothetical protein